MGDVPTSKTAAESVPPDIKEWILEFEQTDAYYRSWCDEFLERRGGKASEEDVERVLLRERRRLEREIIQLWGVSTFVCDPTTQSASIIEGVRSIGRLHTWFQGRRGFPVFQGSTISRCMGVFAKLQRPEILKWKRRLKSASAARGGAREESVAGPIETACKVATAAGLVGDAAIARDLFDWIARYVRIHKKEWRVERDAELNYVGAISSSLVAAGLPDVERASLLRTESRYLVKIKARRAVIELATVLGQLPLAPLELPQSTPITNTSTSAAVAPLTRNGKMLIGWHDILKAIARPNNQNTSRQIRRYCEQYDGPIKSLGRKPTVDEGELIAWFSNLGERTAAANARRKDVAAGRAAQLKHPLDQQAIGLHTKRRRES